MQRRRVLVLLSLSVLAALAISACGGNSGGDEDPQQVLDATFNGDQTITSGNLDLSVNIDAEGGSSAGTLEASLNGPFQSSDNGGVPQFDLTAEAKVDSSAQDFSGSAGLISTGDSAFVNFQDTDYEVPANVFSQFKASYDKAQQQSQGQQDQNQNFLSSLGVDPSSWLTDLSNDGNEDVEGTDTIHISGQADVPKLIADLKKIVKKVPQAAGQVTPAQLSQFDQLSRLVKSADVDIFTGADDDILRKLEANIEIDPPAGSTGAPDSLTVGFTVTFSDVNEPQTISAPANAQPLSGLLQQFGVDPSQLGQLGSAIGSGSSSGGSGGSASTGASSSASQAYLECLGKAQGQAAIDQCAALLGQ